MNFKPKFDLWAPLQKNNNNENDKCTIYQTVKKLQKSILKFTARTLWNMTQYVEEFKSYKKVNFKNVQ